MTVIAPETTDPPATSSARVASAASLLFAVCLFCTVASVNVPHDPSDAELVAWWQQPGNRFDGTVSSFFAVFTAAMFAVMVNHVRRLPGVAGAPAWLAFARTMGTAFTTTMLISAALRGVIGHLVDWMDQPLPSADVLRYSTALDYTLLDLSVMAVLALTIAAISVLTLRTAVLARWTAYVGLGSAIVIFGAVAAQIGASAIPAALLWAVCLSIALWHHS